MNCLVRVRYEKADRLPGCGADLTRIKAHIFHINFHNTINLRWLAGLSKLRRLEIALMSDNGNAKQSAKNQYQAIQNVVHFHFPFDATINLCRHGCAENKYLD
jgi:hypothetical protein